MGPRASSDSRRRGILFRARSQSMCALAWLVSNPLPSAAASCAPNPNYCYSLMVGTGTAHESGVSMYFNYPTSTTFHIGDAAHWLNTTYFTTSNGHVLEMGVCLENNN